jgi:Lysylphosphatidylglycerol synthase TM region
MRLHLQPGAIQALRAVAVVAVAGAFLWALWGQVGEIEKHEWHLSWAFIALAVGCALVRGPLIALPWWKIVQGWGYALGWWRSLRIYFHSGLARYIPGQYWYVLSRALLAERADVPKSVVTAATLVETVIVTGSAGGVALLGLSQVPSWPDGIGALLLAGGLLAPIALAVAVGSSLSARFWDWLMRLARRAPLVSRLKWQDAIVSLTAAYGNWLLYGLIAVFALAGVSQHSDAYLMEAPAIIGCFTASVLGAAVVLFVPQGIVVREGVFVYLLSSLLGVPVPEAVAAAALTRLLATLADGMWATAALRF